MNWRLAMVVLWASGLAGLGAPPVAAADKLAGAANEIIYPSNPASRTESAPGRGPSYRSVLLVAMVLAGAGGWLFWRGRLTPGGAVPARKLAIAETKSLGNRQYLVVASYEDKKYLLGVCPGRIELLTPLDGTPLGK